MKSSDALTNASSSLARGAFSSASGSNRCSNSDFPFTPRLADVLIGAHEEGRVLGGPVCTKHQMAATRARGVSRSDTMRPISCIVRSAFGLFVLVAWTTMATAQVPPSVAERAGYTDLLAAAARGDAAQIRTLTAKGDKTDVRDGHGRTPLHVAAYLGRHEAMRALVVAGADPNALEHDRYDIVTIAAVASDVPTLRVALALGASAKNVTSRYDGTALIAAAHLGHAEVVRILIRAGAPLDHVNNLVGRHSSSPSCSAMAARVTRRRSEHSWGQERT
jgi:Ankyrin repeats (3 copies)/Ankyrin repeat